MIGVEVSGAVRRRGSKVEIIMLRAYITAGGIVIVLFS